MIISWRLKIRHVTIVIVCVFYLKLFGGGANSNDEIQTAIDLMLLYFITNKSRLETRRATGINDVTSDNLFTSGAHRHSMEPQAGRGALYSGRGQAERSKED
jgi:hypothetical protein